MKQSQRNTLTNNNKNCCNLYNSIIDETEILEMNEEDNEIPSTITSLNFEQNILCINLIRTNRDQEKLLYMLQINSKMKLENTLYNLKAEIKVEQKCKTKS